MTPLDVEENSRTISNYTVLDIIGTGSFGTCYKVKCKSTNKCYVWKAVDYAAMTLREKELLVTEVNLMGTLRHPNIVHYYGRIIHKSSGTLYIIMEWCQGGDLDSLINICRQKMLRVNEKFVWKVMYQTAKALEVCHSFLHQKTILHRDIKPANLFLDKSYNVKLGDFGLAKILQNNVNFSSTVVGTPYYMSPEQIRGMKYDKKSDIWSLGCLLYELCTLRQPFNGSSIDELRTNILNNKLAKIPSSYSDCLDKMVKLLLSSDFESRPSVEMIVHHPTVIGNYDKCSTPFIREQSSIPKEGEEPFKAETSSFTKQKKKSYRTSVVKEKNTDYVEYSIDWPSDAIQPFFHSDPKKITEDVFNEKLIDRLKLLQVKETALKAREDCLKQRERYLISKEAVLVQKQKQIEQREREIVLLRFYETKESNENWCKTHEISKTIEKKYASGDDLESTTCSADPGDQSVAPTVTKLDPTKIIKPSFFKTSKQSENNKHLFEMDQHQQQQIKDLNQCRKPFVFLQNYPFRESGRQRYISLKTKPQQSIRK